MKQIIVNATAIRMGGALTILYQFLDKAVCFDTYKYFVFVHPSVEFKKYPKHINLIPIDVVGLKRIYWDFHGCKYMIKRLDLHPSSVISLQNTGLCINKDIPQWIYFHQYLSLDKHRWNLFKKNERTYFFYKHIYPFFIRLFLNPNTKIIVQQKFIKDAFIEKFKTKDDNVFIITPNIENPNIERIKIREDINNGYINLFYPTLPATYKNFGVLFKALQLMSNSEKDKVRLYLTVTESCLREMNIILPSEIKDSVIFLGLLSKDKLYEYYASIDAIVFPSKIETVGLGLLEAAAFGKKILVADLPYARDLLNDYEGKVYVDSDNHSEWHKEIYKLINNKRSNYPLFIKDNLDSWDLFFHSLEI